METISRVDQGWQVSFVHPVTKRPVTVLSAVPGNIADDLMRNGLLPDLYFGRNALLGLDWEETDFTYAVALRIPALTKTESAVLRFEGIDTAATILVDGVQVGVSENMFIPAEIDLSRFGGRTVRLEVRIGNIAAAADRNRVKFGTSPADFQHMNRPEALVLRKAQHSFGWDIAPRLVFGGLWRPVTLRVRRGPMLHRESVFFRVESISADRSRAVVRLSGSVSSLTPESGSFSVRFTAACGESRFASDCGVIESSFDMRIEVAHPRLWWPAGYGDPALYQADLVLLDGSAVVDGIAFMVGIRTVSLEVRNEPSRPSENRFSFVVNAEPVFCRGSNWVPVDALHRPRQDDMYRTLSLYLESNCNMLRVWGGGVYEDEGLFDFCDRYGLMVWQDFMFGCAFYPQSAEFLAEAGREARSVVSRYRNHPSLVLWAGDNETDASFLWHDSGDLLPSQNRLSREVLAAVVAELDPTRPYLASSPILPDEAVRMKSDTVVAEQHLWGPRGYYKDPYYSKNTAAFASEIGYHGCPQQESLAAFLSPGKVWGEWNNDEWLLHATEPTGRPDGRVSGRNDLMRTQVRGVFGGSVDPKDRDRFVLASQIVQAEAVKYYIEHFRSRKPLKTGILWWNMRDMWPQFSDAVVDYFFRRKLALGYIARAQRPVCLLVREEDDRLALVAVNDTLGRPRVAWTLSELDNSVKLGSGELVLAPNSATVLAEFVQGSEMGFWLIEWTADADRGVNHYVTGRVPWDFDRYREFLGYFQSRTGDRNDFMDRA